MGSTALTVPSGHKEHNGAIEGCATDGAHCSTNCGWIDGRLRVRASQITDIGVGRRCCRWIAASCARSTTSHIGVCLQWEGGVDEGYELEHGRAARIVMMESGTGLDESVLHGGELIGSNVAESERGDVAIAAGIIWD